MVKTYQQKMPVNELCRWMLLPRSNFYYHPSDGKRGFAPSAVTGKRDGSSVSNQAVIDEIKQILSAEFVCYGYRKVTVELKSRDFIINHKKVYRLMDEGNLLLGKVIRTSGKRTWVKHRRIEATKPMEYLCLDIKYLWVQGEQRYYYLLTILDVYTRKNLLWILQRSIRKFDVINMFRQLQRTHGIKGVNVRNDNGSQFIANDVRQFLRAAEANQEFTHVATPEENAYIEAYHSIVQREVVERFEFESYYEALQTLKAYVDFYNNRRIHSGTGYKTPQRKWDEYEISKFTPSGEAEAGNAGGQPARNILTDGDDQEGAFIAPSTPAPTSSLSADALKNSTSNVSFDLNSFEVSVQVMGG